MGLAPSKDPIQIPSGLVTRNFSPVSTCGAKLAGGADTLLGVPPVAGTRKTSLVELLVKMMTSSRSQAPPLTPPTGTSHTTTGGPPLMGTLLSWPCEKKAMY